MAVSKTIISKTYVVRNINMASINRSTYISERTTDIIKCTTANLRFSTTANSKRVSLGDFNNDRQPEMGAESEVLISLEHYVM